MVQGKPIVLLACYSLLHAGAVMGFSYASTSADVSDSSHTYFGRHNSAVEDLMYVREPEPGPEPDLYEFEERGHEDDDDDDDADDEDEDDHHHRRYLEEGDEYHHRRATLDHILQHVTRDPRYVIDIPHLFHDYHPAREVDEEEEERLSRRTQLDRIMELAARYSTHDGADDGHNTVTHNYLAARELEARQALGMALRPLAKEFGNVIKQIIIGKTQRRDVEELETRQALGMALRPLAKEFGNVIKQILVDKINKRDELESRQALGMALRPIAKEFGNVIKQIIQGKAAGKRSAEDEGSGITNEKPDLEVRGDSGVSPNQKASATTEQAPYVGAQKAPDAASVQSHE